MTLTDLSIGDNQLEFFVQEKENYFRRLTIEELKKSALAPSFDIEYLKKKKTTYNKLTAIKSLDISLSNIAKNSSNKDKKRNDEIDPRIKTEEDAGFAARLGLRKHDLTSWDSIIKFFF